MTLSSLIERLEADCERLRRAAHEAPFAEWSMDHRGHTSIVKHTSAWATRSNEWLAACDRLDRARSAMTEEGSNG